MTIIMGIVLLVGALAIAISRKPDIFRVERNAIISAPPASVFPHINDIPAWHRWSPWVEMDPDAKMTLSGPQAGVGASMHWEGKKTGKGTMTITDSMPNERIVFRLDFTKPMVATNTVYFRLADDGGKTRITWSMEGKNSLMSKAMSLVMNCEKMVGEQYEQGLANLEAVVTGKR